MRSNVELFSLLIKTAGQHAVRATPPFSETIGFFIFYSCTALMPSSTGSDSSS